MFSLHPQLSADTVVVGELSLCQVLLAKDANYPWLILVPMRSDVTEIYQLSESDQQQLLKESSLVAEKTMALFGGDKMNVAALGNMVPQLHLHHIVRFRTDAAWPGPSWGAVEAKPYAEDELAQRVERLRGALEL